MRLFHLPTARKFWATLAAAIIAATLGTITLTQQPASAARSDCTNYRHVVCVFKNAYYGGSVARYDFTKASGRGCKNLPAWMEDQGSSFMANWSGKYVSAMLYSSMHCQGGSKATISNVGNYPLEYKVLPSKINNKTVSIWIG
jgi:hypothetical protein